MITTIEQAVAKGREVKAAFDAGDQETFDTGLSLLQSWAMFNGHTIAVSGEGFVSVVRGGAAELLF